MLIDHSQQRIRAAQDAMRQRQRLQDYGDHMHRQAPWDCFGTISFRRARSSESAFGGVELFCQDMQRAAESPNAWAIAVSRGEVGDRLHAHLLIAGVGHLDLRRWDREACRRFGDCKLENYDEERGGAHYWAKNALSDAGDYRLGGKLLDGSEKRTVTGAAATSKLAVQTDPDFTTATPRRGPGRPRRTDLDPSEIARMRYEDGLSLRQIAKLKKTGATTVDRLLRSVSSGLPNPTPGRAPQNPGIAIPTTGELSENRSETPVQIYIAGIGARRDGTSSGGYAWTHLKTGRKVIEKIPGIGKTEAQWRGLESVLSHIRRGRTVEVVTDSPMLVAQFEDRLPTFGKRSFLHVVARVFKLIDNRNLNVTVVWLPGRKNPAAKLLKAALRKR